MASAKVRAPPGGPGSGTDLTESQEGNRQRPASHLPLPPLRKAREGRGRSQAGRQRGRFLTDQMGRNICFGYGEGVCTAETCPKGFVHICQKCLGKHPLKSCPGLRKAEN